MGKLLLFVTKKADAEEVAKKLKLRDIQLVLLHGDMLQHERNEQITAFRTNVPVMVSSKEKLFFILITTDYSGCY